MRRRIVQAIKCLVPEAYERRGLEGFNFILTEFDVFEQLNSTYENHCLLNTKKKYFNF